MEIFVNCGNGQKITVNPYRITGAVSRELREKIHAAMIKIIYKDFPPLENETRAAYDARLKAHREAKKKELEEKKASKKGNKKAAEEVVAEEDKETVVDFTKKELNLTRDEDQLDYLYTCVEAIAETFEQSKKFSREAIENETLIDVNNFVAKVCKYCRISTAGIEEIVMPYDQFE